MAQGAQPWPLAASGRSVPLPTISAHTCVCVTCDYGNAKLESDNKRRPMRNSVGSIGSYIKADVWKSLDTSPYWFVALQTDGWLDGWMDGWMDGWG
eukprot:921930-Prorocentrum_minimum.AAC.1